MFVFQTNSLDTSIYKKLRIKLIYLLLESLKKRNKLRLYQWGPDYFFLPGAIF
jgi:hypothetical protein